MIIVNAAMKQEDIKTALAASGYSYVKQAGLKLYFEAPTADDATEAANAKKILKAVPALSGVFFNTEVGK